MLNISGNGGGLKKFSIPTLPYYTAFAMGSFVLILIEVMGKASQSAFRCNSILVLP